MEIVKFEEIFFSSTRWDSGRECLNLKDINEPPAAFLDGKETWIKELTTFITLYPKEWSYILTEYNALLAQRMIEGNNKLVYFRDEEGYLRRIEEKDIYLRIHFEIAQDIDYLNEIGEQIMHRWGFKAYEEYCNHDLPGRDSYIKQLQNNLLDMLNFRYAYKISVSYENDFEESNFLKKDLYIDQLNQCFIII